MNVWLQALALSFSLQALFFNLLGTLIGIVIGALPGLTSTMGVALAVPLTYGMHPVAGFAMLGGLYCGSVYGGSITAILVNTPGTPAGAATVLDGFPMTQKGRAIEALGYAAISSFIGGLVGVAALALFAPMLAKVALSFGPAEYFAVMVFGITIISSISGKAIAQGIFSGLLGMFLGAVGFDPVMGTPRFADGIMGLYGGFEIVPALIGLFSIPQVIDMVTKSTAELKTGALSGHIPSFSDLKRFIPSFIRSSLIGTFIGILPGAGTTIATFLSYNEARRFSKHPEKFGTGIPDGIVATETSNNAVVGGSLVPLLTLGIPGNAVSAVFLGALTIQGLKPGPFLFQEQTALVYSLFISLAIAHFFFLAVGLGGVRLFPQILKLSPTALAGGIVILGTVGAFALRNEMFDVWAMLGFGLLGCFLKKIRIPTAPVILGFILGPMIESNFVQAMLVGDGSLMTFVMKPISLTFLILALLSFSTPLLVQFKAKSKKQPALEETEEEL